MIITHLRSVRPWVSAFALLKKSYVLKNEYNLFRTFSHNLKFHGRSSSSCTNPLKPTITHSHLSSDSTYVDITFSDGLQARYHAIWLRDHCLCDQCIHPITLQRCHTPTSSSSSSSSHLIKEIPYPSTADMGFQPHKAYIITKQCVVSKVGVTSKEGQQRQGGTHSSPESEEGENSLQLEWRPPSLQYHTSEFSASWLRRNVYFPLSSSDKINVTVRKQSPSSSSVSSVSSRVMETPSSFATSTEFFFEHSTPLHDDDDDDDVDVALDTRSQLRWMTSHFTQLSYSTTTAATIEQQPGGTGRGNQHTNVPEQQEQQQQQQLHLPTQDALSFIRNDTTLLSALQQIRDVGFVLLTNIPSSMISSEGTEVLLRRISPLRATLYGTGMWTTHVAPDQTSINDTAYTAAALPSHTDCNYLHDPPGLQAFHALQAADDRGGGSSLLVDGFAVAEGMRNSASKEDRLAYELLCTTMFTYHHTDPDNIFHSSKPVFVVDQTMTKKKSKGGEGDIIIRRVHFNNDDRCTISPRYVFPTAVCDGGNVNTSTSLEASLDIPAIYTALGLVQRYFKDPRFELKFQLRPGNLLIFNNNRILHGREGFSTTSGRTLAGAYISEEDWHSKLRVLAKKTSPKR